MRKWSVGSIITFGTYEQDNNKANGKEAIRWRVLAREGNKALLIAEQNLDAQPYNRKHTRVTWKTCTLRAWMNNYFLNAAFTEEEQRAILTTVSKSDYQEISDKVFLLRLKETEKYFPRNEDRVAKNTAYVAQRAYTSENGAGQWWVIPDDDDYGSSGAYFTRTNGIIERGYIQSTHVDVCNSIRPALWFDMTFDNLTSEAL